MPVSKTAKYIISCPFHYPKQYWYYTLKRLSLHNRKQVKSTPTIQHTR